MDEELFGAAPANRQLKLRKKMKDMMLHLRRLHSKAKRSCNKAKNANGGIEKRMHVSSMNKVKDDMRLLCRKIVSVWRKLSKKAKAMWKKNNKGHRQTPADFIAKFGPHTLQA